MDNDTRYVRIFLMNESADRHEADTGVVNADKGYDSDRNNALQHSRGITPVIHIRRLPGNAPFDGIFTVDGATHLRFCRSNYHGVHEQHSESGESL